MPTSKRKSFAQQIGQKVEQTLAKEADSEVPPPPAPEPSPAPPANTPVRQGSVAPDGTPEPTAEAQEIAFKKFTVPLRTDQLAEMDDQLWDLGYRYRVDISKASLIRLALDRLLENLRRDPDSVLRAVYRLEQKELRMNEDRRKFSVSKGLAEYLEKTSTDAGK